jgi:hypothetical protein
VAERSQGNAKLPANSERIPTEEVERLVHSLNWAHYSDIAVAFGDLAADLLDARRENERLRAERQAVIDCVTLYGDEVLHQALDHIGFAPSKRKPAAALSGEETSG